MGSPAFDRVSIRLHNGKTLRVICRNNSVDNKYINSVRLNGQTQNRVWFRHSDVLDGLTIELGMSDTPNTALGVTRDSLPPSSMGLDPSPFRRPPQKPP